MNHNTVITFSNRLQLYSKFLYTQHETACTACRMCKKYFMQRGRGDISSHRAVHVLVHVLVCMAVCSNVLEYTNNTESGVTFLESSFTKFSTSYNRMSHDKQSTKLPCMCFILTLQIAKLIITVYLGKIKQGTLRITHRSRKFRIIISWLIYKEISERKICLPIF